MVEKDPEIKRDFVWVMFIQLIVTVALVAVQNGDVLELIALTVPGYAAVISISLLIILTGDST